MSKTEELNPTSGGSYVRNADGSLKQTSKPTASPLGKSAIASTGDVASGPSPSEVAADAAVNASRFASRPPGKR